MYQRLVAVARRSSTVKYSAAETAEIDDFVSNFPSPLRLYKGTSLMLSLFRREARQGQIFFASALLLLPSLLLGLLGFGLTIRGVHE
jgi:hypothetical protein